MPNNATVPATPSLDTSFKIKLFDANFGSESFIDVSALQTLAQGSDLTIAEGKNIVTGITTGTKIGAATAQKIGFWNATPIVQPTTAVAAATFVTNAGTAVNDASTFDGYTLGKVVKALRNAGLLA